VYFVLKIYLAISGISGLKSIWVFPLCVDVNVIEVPYYFLWVNYGLETYIFWV